MGVHYHKSNISADGIIFQIDAANKLCDNTIQAVNIANPTQIGTFQSGMSVVNNNAYLGDGVDNSIDFGTNINIGQTFTITIWFTKLQNGKVLLGNSVDNEYGFWFQSSSTVWFAYISPSSFGNVSMTPVPNDNSWHTITCTRNGTSTHSIYLDNVFQGTLNAGSGNDFEFRWVGREFDIPAHAWNGKIGSVMIWNRVLSVDEMHQNYVSQKSKYL